MNVLRPRVLRLYRPPPPFIGHVRHLATARPSTKLMNSSRFAIASAITLGSGYLIFSSVRNPALSEQQQPPLSAFTTSTPTSTLAELDDMGNRIAVRSKSTYDLWLSLGIYKACASSWIVNLAPHLISAAEKMGLSTPVYWVIKSSFFAYFCGGETADECIPVMEKLTRSGIGSILDLSIEADIDHAGDRQEYAESAEHVTQLTLKSVGAAAQENGMAAIKVTAFSSPMTLLSLNKWFDHAREEFASHMDQHGRIDRKTLLDITSKLSMGKSQVDLMPEQVTDVDWIDYMRLVSPQNPKAQQVMMDAGVSNEDLADFKHCIDRLERVCDLAKTKHVKIMVDAEQSYFQRTIDHIAMILQAKYNHRLNDDDTSMPVVLNTYQMYTKEAQSKLAIDVELARREGFVFGAKLVRGAYMVSERKRAAELGIPSPICDTLQDTHNSYNGGVVFLLNKIHQHAIDTNQPTSLSSTPIVFMVASHNRDSVKLTIKEMDRNGVLPRTGVVTFGQLFGMQDQISYCLGKNGYSIYKYLPYGQIQEVIPYLLRRAQENSAIFGGGAVTMERKLMWDEAKTRLWGQPTPEVITTPATDGAAAAPNTSSDGVY
ncbi:unnamed protein product [Umbelopsis ramanniana]